MKLAKIILIFSLSLVYSKSALCQDKVYKERASTKVLVDESSTKEVKKENVNLQRFVESIYITSSKYYNQALPLVKKGEFFVLVERADGSRTRMATKELKGIPANQIEELTYKKSVTYGALYGTYAKMFGIVIIKLKN